MSTLADTTPVSLEQAEEASAGLGDQLQRARQVLSDYRAVMGAPSSDNDNA